MDWSIIICINEQNNLHGMSPDWCLTCWQSLPHDLPAGTFDQLAVSTCTHALHWPDLHHVSIHPYQCTHTIPCIPIQVVNITRWQLIYASIQTGKIIYSWAVGTCPFCVYCLAMIIMKKTHPSSLSVLFK